MNFNKHHFLNELQKAKAANVSESLNESTETLNEKAKFSRLPKDLNAMWNLKNSVESMVGRYDNGDDYDPKVMRTIEEFIKEIKKAAKSFNSKEEVIGTVYEARAYNLKASEFGGNTMADPYKVKNDAMGSWRVHSTYAVDQVSGENDPDARDVLFFEVMPIKDEIVVKLGGINNLKRSNGSAYGKFFSGTKEDFKKDPKKFAKEASDFLTKGDQLKWANKNVFTKSEGKKIKWAMKDDYTSVIEDLIKKAI